MVDDGVGTGGGHGVGVMWACSVIRVLRVLMRIALMLALMCVASSMPFAMRVLLVQLAVMWVWVVMVSVFAFV